MLSKLKNILLWPFRFFKKLSWKKKLLLIVAILIAFIVTSSVLNANKKPEYTAAKAEVNDITEIVSETGSIAATGKTDIFSPTNGVVTEILVQNGSVVADGETLFKVESSASDQDRQTAYSNYLAAVATLNAEKARMHSLQAAKFEANEIFMNDRGVDNPSKDQKDDPVYIQQDSNWKKAEADYINQEGVINQAQAQVNAASLAYAATQNATVRAPIAGQVSNLSVSVGSSVNASTPTMTARPVLALSTVAVDPVTEVTVSFSETDIAKIDEGQEATIDVVAVDDKTYEGIVRRFDTIGTDTQGVVRYNVYVEVLNPDDSLRPGMNVDVDIVTNTVEDVLTVPNAAVRPYQGKRAVRVYDPGTNDFKFVPVEIGIRGDKLTQITKGLTERQEVVVSLSNEQVERPGLFGS